jgi:hypothetical protein
MASGSDLLNAGFDAVSSQVSHGKAAEITVDPSGDHGHHGEWERFYSDG